MIPYSVALLWAYSAYFALGRVPPQVQALVLLLGLLPLVLLATLRYSGTDTTMYEYALWVALDSGRPTGFEPGFDWLARGLTILTGSEVVGVRLIALTYSLLLAVFAYRADQVERHLLFLFYIPAFFFQYGMNAVRAGLALAFILLAWQSLRRGNKASAGVLALLASLFHISALVIVFPVAIPEVLVRVDPRWQTVARWLLLAGALAALLLGWERLHDKFEFYTTLANQEHFDPMRGASRTLMVLLVSLGLLLAPLRPFSKALGLALVWSIALPSQLIATVSEAGPRLLEISALLAPLLAIRLHDLDRQRVSKTFLALLLVAGLIGGGFFFRQQLRDWGGQYSGSPTPFFPYRTVFQHNPCPPSSYYPFASLRNCPFLDPQKNPDSLHLLPNHTPLPY